MGGIQTCTTIRIDISGTSRISMEEVTRLLADKATNRPHTDTHLNKLPQHMWGEFQ